MINAIQKFVFGRVPSKTEYSKAIALLDCLVYRAGREGGNENLGYIDVERIAGLIKEQLGTVPRGLEREIDTAVRKCCPSRLTSIVESKNCAGITAAFFGFIVTLKGGINCITAISDPLFNVFLPSGLMMIAVGLVTFFMGMYLINTVIDDRKENIKAIITIREALSRYANGGWLN